MNSNSNNFRFGRLKANGARGFVQTETLSGEVHSSVRHPQPHDIESKPPVGSETFSIYQGGNPDNGAVLIVAGQAPVTLSDGETVTYSSGGATVHCKSDGTIELNGAAFGGLIKINELVTWLNAHTHISSGSGIPSTPIVQATIENDEVNHG